MILIRRVYWNKLGSDCLVFIKRDNDPTIKFIENNNIPEGFSLLDSDYMISFSGNLVNPGKGFIRVDLEELVKSLEE